MAKATHVAQTQHHGDLKWLDNRLTLYSFCFFGLSVLYIFLTFLPLPNPLTLRHYNLTEAGYRWLILPIVLFLLVIWLASFYGSLKVKSYANIIHASEDGQAFNLIGAGFMVLALSSPFTLDLNSIFNLTSRYHPHALPTLTIIDNYVSLVLMAAALTLIAAGADRLSSLAGNRLKAWPEHFWVALFIIFSSVYGYFLVGQSAGGNLAKKTYFMPHWLVLLTIVIPYLYFWYRGLKGSHQIHQYQKNVRGRLYKSALNYLAAGIAMVIVSSVVTRTLTTASAHLSNLHLTPLLLIIYSLLAVMASGYLLIAAGAKKLRQIEEV